MDVKRANTLMNDCIQQTGWSFPFVHCLNIVDMMDKVEQINVKSGKVHKKRNRKARPPNKNGVMYIKHIPHGFYEDEMKGYFSQFGKVLKVKVARSEKTGNSQGYGFVQFLDTRVAKIAAETMDNYLMFEKIIKCRVLTPDEVKPWMLRSLDRRPGIKCPALERQKESVKKLSSVKTDEQLKRSRRRRETSLSRTLHHLSSLGIDFKF